MARFFKWKVIIRFISVYIIIIYALILCFLNGNTLQITQNSNNYELFLEKRKYFNIYPSDGLMENNILAKSTDTLKICSTFKFTKIKVVICSKYNTS